MKLKDVIYLLSLLVGFPALVVALFVFWFLGSFGDCITKTDADIRDVAGNNFEIATTHCTGFPAQAYRTVYAKKDGERDETRLFQYHPSDRERLPEIKMPAPGRIVIVAPWVKSSLMRLDRWDGIRIDYETGENIDSRKDRRPGR